MCLAQLHGWTPWKTQSQLCKIKCNASRATKSKQSTRCKRFHTQRMALDQAGLRTSHCVKSSHTHTHTHTHRRLRGEGGRRRGDGGAERACLLWWVLGAVSSPHRSPSPPAGRKKRYAYGKCVCVCVCLCACVCVFVNV